LDKKIITFAVIMIFYAITFGAEISVGLIDSLIKNYSVDEIISGNYDEARKKIRSMEYNDSGMFFLALGEIDLRESKREKAIMNFIVAAEKSEKIAPFAFRRIADMELSQGHLSYAVSAYRIAANKTSFEPYRYFLYSKIDSLRTAFPDSLGSVVWAMLYLNEIAAAGSVVFEESSIQTIENVLKGKKLSRNLYYECLLTAQEKKIVKRYLNLIQDTTIADSALDAKTAFEIAQEMSNQDFLQGASNWLNFAVGKKDFEHEVSKRQYLMFRTQLNYSMKNWTNVIKYGTEYVEKYGDESDLIYKIGRAYRQTGNTKEAHKYYEKHVKAYPNSKITHDILWYLAWDREDHKDFEAAKIQFEKISNQRPVGTRGEESALRVGLLNFRQKKFDLALKEFDKFRAKFPESVYVPASLYWSARTFLAKNDTLSAKKIIDSINARYSLNYYGFRARQLFGDTNVSLIRISDSVWHSRIDKISKNEKSNISASADILDNLLLGIFLGTLGLRDEAELLFEPIENRSVKNYPIVVSLARFYAKTGSVYHSYRLARRIFWAMPYEQRYEFSPQYAKLMYPDAFAKEVEASAQKFDVKPQLIWAVMRQESTFSPQIMSPVGAIGLMQIMPYTGKEIADDLKKDSFETNYLLNPELNIEFGTYYLSKLLKLTDGDFVQTLAGYNGGLHNVKKWLKNNADIAADEPFFVECLGFAETRGYVKKVLENYWVYKLMQF